MPRRSTRPDVSIVIPARNEAATIERALSSVLAQAWPLERLEVIVVDNGSHDRTAAVVRGFAQRHPELLVRLVREPRLGASRARNRGARCARGHVLLFLDADSRLAPTMVASVLAHLHRGESALSLRVVADSTDPIDRAFSSLRRGSRNVCEYRHNYVRYTATSFGRLEDSMNGCAWLRTTISYVGSGRQDMPLDLSQRALS